VPSAIGDAPVAWSAADLSGVDPDGMPIRVDLASSLRRDLPPGVDVVVVTKGPANVRADEVAVTAADVPVPVVMSDGAWADFRVTSYPFLVLVEPHTRRILGESVGFGWSDVAALLDSGGHG
jgi:hypothetical protein